MAVEVILLELGFRRPVVTAKGDHGRRPLVLVHMTANAGARTVHGWGECAALSESTYDDEDAASSLRVLEDQMLPVLLEAVVDSGGSLLGPAPVSGLLDDRGARPSWSVRGRASRAPLARAALEMAVADTYLRATGQSLGGLLGTAMRSVEVGAVVGLAPSIDELIVAVGSLADAGYTRVKVKIAPGVDSAPMTALAGGFPDVRFQVDANGSYSDPDDPVWTRLDRLGLLCIEQPFDRRDLPSHARLSSRISTPVCLDESFDSPMAVEHALDAGACSVVCVKPARLGGIGAALGVIEICNQRHVPMWMGGMFESGFARAQNAALGALPGFAWPGDLSPSGSYLDDDLMSERFDSVKEFHGVDERKTRRPSVVVDGSIGLGPAPSPASIRRRERYRRVMEVHREGRR